VFVRLRLTSERMCVNAGTREMSLMSLATYTRRSSRPWCGQGVTHTHKLTLHAVTQACLHFGPRARHASTRQAGRAYGVHSRGLHRCSHQGSVDEGSERRTRKGGSVWVVAGWAKLTRGEGHTWGGGQHWRVGGWGASVGAWG